MNVVGKVSSFITQGVYSVATPFHPFGGAVDIIVVMQQDGTFRSTPWHVRFGKFQGVLKRAENVVKIEVNGVAADFHMYLDKSGEAYFIQKGETNTNDVEYINGDSNEDRLLDRTDSVELAEFGSSRCEDLDDDEDVLESEALASSSEVVMVSVDGHVLTAPITSSEMNSEDVKLDTPKFHLGPAQRTDFYDGNLEFVDDGCLSDKSRGEQNDVSLVGEEIENGRKERDECAQHENVKRLIEAFLKVIVTGVEASLCGNLLLAEMGSSAAGEAFDANRISVEEFKSSSESIIKNENLVVRIQGNYFSWDRAAPIILGMAECDTEFPVECTDVIPVEHEETLKSREENIVISSVPSGRRWTLWPIPFRSVKAPEPSSCNSSNEALFVDSESISVNQPIEQTETAQLGGTDSSHEQFLRTNVPTSDQVTSLNLKEGQNMVTFIFSTRVLGEQKVESHIYLWKWNARIVISDVDGTITKSDVLGQFMPLVGKDWTHFGTARLFSAIKENGYQLLFLSARAIVQAYLTKNFLFNLKQDGKTLPNGPVVISPDGLFPSLFREVIRRAPHEFKIACLEDIKALFPQDYNPFYAGFGNRDTDEFSYRKVGIPRGKIFIINPKGEVSMNHQFDVKSYTSLHTLVNDMFPPTSMVEQEDFNSWNFWRMPTSDINLS